VNFTHQQVWQGAIAWTPPKAPPGPDGRPDPSHRRSLRACAHLFVPPELMQSDPGFWERYKQLPPTLAFGQRFSLSTFWDFWVGAHTEGALVSQPLAKLDLR